MRLPIINFLRWAQKNPKLLRLIDLSMGAISIVIGIWQDSIVCMVMGALFLLAAIFRIAERINLVLPKLKVPSEDKDV